MRSSTSVFATNGDRNELLILSIGLSALQSVRRYNELQAYPFKAIYVGYLHRLKRFRAFASYQQPKQIESCTIKTAISISISVFCIFSPGRFISFYPFLFACEAVLNDACVARRRLLLCPTSSLPHTRIKQKQMRKNKSFDFLFREKSTEFTDGEQKRVYF